MKRAYAGATASRAVAVFRRSVETARAEAPEQSAAQSLEPHRPDSGALRSTIPPDRQPTVRRPSARGGESSRSRQQIYRHVDPGRAARALEAETVNASSTIDGSRRTVALESHRLMTSDVERRGHLRGCTRKTVRRLRSHLHSPLQAPPSRPSLTRRTAVRGGQIAGPEFMERLSAFRHANRSVGRARCGGDLPIAMCPEDYIYYYLLVRWTEQA